MKCPVCKNEITDDSQICPFCNFDDLHRTFINAEDAAEWMDSVVLPLRSSYLDNMNSSNVFNLMIQKAITNYSEPTLEYQFREDRQGIVLTRYGGKKSVVKIPDEINGRMVYKLGADLFRGCVEIEKVILPQNLVEISSNVFDGCKFRDIEIPDTCEIIGSEAFANSQLTRIVLSKYLREIKNRAFDNSQLKEVIIPSNCKKIADYAFFRTKLSAVSFEGECEYIGKHCFSQSMITEIVIPEGCKTIGDYAFYQTQLVKLIVPETCVEIGKNAFGGTKISEIVIPKSVECISKGLFENCKNLQTVIVLGAKIIEDNAFANCKMLSKLYLPETLEMMSERSITLNRTKIEKVIFPPKLNEINIQQLCGEEDPYAPQKGKYKFAFLNDKISIKGMSKNFSGYFYCNMLSTAQSIGRQYSIKTYSISEFPME